jgi:hypothetical protein
MVGDHPGVSEMFVTEKSDALRMVRNPLPRITDTVVAHGTRLPVIRAACSPR